MIVQIVPQAPFLDQRVRYDHQIPISRGSHVGLPLCQPILVNPKWRSAAIEKTAISLQRFDRSAQNLKWWCIFSLHSTLAVKNSNIWKSPSLPSPPIHPSFASSSLFSLPLHSLASQPFPFFYSPLSNPFFPFILPSLLLDVGPFKSRITDSPIQITIYKIRHFTLMAKLLTFTVDFAFLQALLGER